MVKTQKTAVQLTMFHTMLKHLKKILLNSCFYPDRFEIDDSLAKAFPKMIKYLYRTLAHTFFHHTNLFDSLEDKFKICERFTLYCKSLK
jgi:hypothetical protein